MSASPSALRPRHHLMQHLPHEAKRCLGQLAHRKAQRWLEARLFRAAVYGLPDMRRLTARCSARLSAAIQVELPSAAPKVMPAPAVMGPSAGALL